MDVIYDPQIKYRHIGGKMTFNLAWLISVKIIYVKHTMCVCVFDESYSCNINDMILRYMLNHSDQTMKVQVIEAKNEELGWIFAVLMM